MEADKIPTGFDDIKKSCSRKNKLALKAIGRMPMAKGLLEGMMTDFQLKFKEFEKEHGRPPTEKEAQAMGKEIAKSLLNK